MTTNKTMKAVRIGKHGGLEVLQVDENVPMPTPEENDVGIAVFGQIVMIYSTKSALHSVVEQKKVSATYDCAEDEWLGRKTDHKFKLLHHKRKVFYEVLIRVYAAGINPVDTYIRQGLFGQQSFPHILGLDAAGVVEAVGSNVTRFKPGERVYASNRCKGSYAEFCIAPESACFKLADRLSYAQGASVGIPYFTAYRALFQKGHAVPSNTVFIHGASGAVGLAACQIARAAGLIVYGTAGTEAGLKLVLSNGAHHAFNHNDPEYCKKFLAKTGGQGADVILEMLSNVNLAKDLELVKRGGVVTIIGSRGECNINPRDFMAKEATAVGIMLSFATEKEFLEIGYAITAGLEKGFLCPVVNKEYSLKDIADAHRDQIENSGSKGKLILTIRKH